MQGTGPETLRDTPSSHHQQRREERTKFKYKLGIVTDNRGWAVLDCLHFQNLGYFEFLFVLNANASL